MRPGEQERELGGEHIEGVANAKDDFVGREIKLEGEAVRIVSLDDPDSVVNDFLPLESLHLQSEIH